MAKILLSGDEAVARGAWEAGCRVAAAYPGTPSTEILEALATYPELDSRWTSNEKVALEVAGGAAMGGVRALAAMKHVGLNVAADPLLTFGYTGVRGGLVVVSADDPGCHSSQNEQDNRHYARLAKILMLEPADSQECLDYSRAAFELSERFDSPVLLRLTTRICHSQGLVQTGERHEAPVKPYERDVRKFAMMPAFARLRHLAVEEKLKHLADFAADCVFNRLEWGRDKKIGVLSSGVAYQYAREVFGDQVSYLKLGLTFPFPERLIATFARAVDKIYVLEEGDPYLENAVRALGFDCLGKELLPLTGEFDAGLLRRAFLPADGVRPLTSPLLPPPRPPVLCAGCPHRGLLHILGENKKRLVAAGDIGCYTLGLQPPLEGLDSCICMGAGFSAAIGLSTALKAAGDPRRVFGVVGDSTFFHSGLTGLVDAIHARADLGLVILDNSITAMTGHQENPGTARDLMGRPAPPLNLEAVILGLGLPEGRLTVLDPLDRPAVQEAVDTAIGRPGLSVIIARRPCVLIKDLKGSFNKKCRVEADRCKKCKMCLKVGCPAVSFEDGHSQIDEAACLGCGYCLAVCRFEAIRLEEVTR
ncbi:MAG: indolepyruvate ferredoxin oxidoreductase subunit alpha [Candidatus Adiutrix sp.]|jgi:indolepyruvate ferredoxin oxidoreductase alpha subunit|nr:indolepyruvate ferredoxin oxidoreductase subunit alpha [Candidatus Adiutrix sp.]